MCNFKLFVGSLAVTLGAGLAPSFAAPPFGTFELIGQLRSNSATCGGPSYFVNTTGPCATLNQALQNASPGNNIVVIGGGAFGPIFLNGAKSIAGPEDKSLQIINSAAAPGCIGAAPGTCAASAAAAIEVNAGSTDQIKLGDIARERWQFRFGRHPY